MFNHLIRLSLQNRRLILFISLVCMFYGSYLATKLPIDVFPDLDRPRVVLLTECPGYSPEEVEAVVALQIETNLLGAPGVQAVRSQCSLGLVVTYIEFAWSVESKSARQIVQERLANLSSSLPDGIRPQITPPTSIMGQIMMLGMSRRMGPNSGWLHPIPGTNKIAELAQDHLSITIWEVGDIQNTSKWLCHAPNLPATLIAKNSFEVDVTDLGKVQFTFKDTQEFALELRTTADWYVRPQLLKESGVAEVIVMGGERKQYQIIVDPNKLLQYGVSLQEVELAIQQNNLNASGGVTQEADKERAIRVFGRLGSNSVDVITDIKTIPIPGIRKRPVLLENVAEIIEAAAPKRGDGGVDGANAVVLNIVKQPNTDTRALTEQIKKRIQELEHSLGIEIKVHDDLFQLRDFIDRGIYYVGEALSIGSILVMVVLFLFLFQFRTTLITLTAIPLSLVVTTFVFRLISWFTGIELSINVMTLGGIAVAMGELVDDAIVDVENIYRRLRENSQKEAPVSRLKVVYEASREIRSSVVFGTIVVILAFLPIFALSGIEGRLFQPLGFAYIISILASLIVSLTVTPVLSYYLLKPAKHQNRETWTVRFLKWIAVRLIRISLKCAPLLLLFTWLLSGYCFAILFHLGADFLPKFDEGSIQLNINLPSGSSLQATNQATSLIDKKLQSYIQNSNSPSNPIRHFVRRSGRAERDEHAEPVSRTEYILSINPNALESRKELLAKLLKELREEIPGVDIEAEQPMAHLISHLISGVNAQIAIKIFGEDLHQLQSIANQIKDIGNTLPGLTPPVIDPQEYVDEVHITLRQEDLIRFGISRKWVAHFVEIALKGDVISEVFEESRRFDLVMRLESNTRINYDKLGELRITLPNGKGQIQLKEVANISLESEGPNQINRDNLRRRAVVRCNVSEGDLESIVLAYKDKVSSTLSLPKGYSIEFGGQFQAQREATRVILLLSILSTILIFLVLYTLFPSIRVSLQILNAIPTAFIGGVIALVLTKQTLTVAALVGFVSLGGIAVRNGILLVTHYIHLMKYEHEAFNSQMILRGSLERMSPVLMTALTAGIALLPLVFGGNKPGLEILYPVSTVIFGGLITSTCCEFLIHPGIFWWFSGKDAAELASNQQESEKL